MTRRHITLYQLLNSNLCCHRKRFTYESSLLSKDLGVRRSSKAALLLAVVSWARDRSSGRAWRSSPAGGWDRCDGRQQLDGVRDRHRSQQLDDAHPHAVDRSEHGGHAAHLRASD